MTTAQPAGGGPAHNHPEDANPVHVIVWYDYV